MLADAPDLSPYLYGSPSGENLDFNPTVAEAMRGLCMPFLGNFHAAYFENRGQRYPVWQHFSLCVQNEHDLAD